jgi:hypothetical protein
MTTYSFTLNLDEQEFWAIKEAIDFYLTNEAEDLRRNHPHLVKYAAAVRLKELLSSGKLYENIETLSTNNFQETVKKDFFTANNQISIQQTLFDLIFEKLVTNPQLMESAQTPIVEMFLNDPLLGQLVLDSILDILEMPHEFVKIECQSLLISNEARENFCRVIGLQLFNELQTRGFSQD